MKTSLETKNCKLRFAFKTTAEDGTESHRTTYLCKKRNGLFIKDWKCVGIENDKCPLKQQKNTIT